MTDYIGFDGVADGPRPGLEGLVRAVELATGRRVWNLGTWVVRNKRRPDGTDLGTTSVHATGRAADLSRRAMDGRRVGDVYRSRPSVDMLLEGTEFESWLSSQDTAGLSIDAIRS